MSSFLLLKQANSLYYMFLLTNYFKLPSLLSNRLHYLLFLQPHNSLTEWLYFNTCNYFLEVSVKRWEENVSSADSKMASLQSRVRWVCSIVKNGNYSIFRYTLQKYTLIYFLFLFQLRKTKTFRNLLFAAHGQSNLNRPVRNQEDYRTKPKDEATRSRSFIHVCKHIWT